MATASIKQLIWQTRRLFQHLRTVSESLLEETDINTSQRAVLEFLYREQPATVPHMAKQLSVSRQHIQVIVNELLKLKLVNAIENPAHKRSPLMETTCSGNQLFESIEEIEAEFINKLQKKFPMKDLQTTLETLQAFDDLLAARAWTDQ